MEANFFEEIDEIVARTILEKAVHDKSCLTALSYLFAITRRGHHCLSMDHHVLKPSPENIFQGIESTQNFSEEVILGLSRLPKEVFQEDTETLNLKPIVKKGCSFYLQKYFFLEKKIAHHIKRLFESSLRIPFLKEDIEKELSLYLDKLNAEQVEAIVRSLLQPIHSLTGGPGTGKTYTVQYLLRVYEGLCKKQGKQLRVLIAAPTGKATAHLKEKLFKHKGIEVSTLHRALKIRQRNGLRQDLSLFKDLIIIDECSMVDLHLWTALLSAINGGARLVLMGDHHQLSPVETGMVFEELIKVLPCSYLKTCMRTESTELVKFATAIKNNSQEDLQVLLDKAKREEGEMRYFEYEKEKELFSLDQFSPKKGCLLSPILDGPWGVDALNRQLYAFFLAESKQDSIMTVPIMITKTDYQQELYNGEIGFLIKTKNESEEHALFESKEEKSAVCKIMAACLPQYQYAYALSVHKSQGSEYDEVFLFLPEGSQYFGKEVVYTAVTRAKKKLTIFAKKGVLKKCLETESKKNSSLSECIHLNRNQD